MAILDVTRGYEDGEILTEAHIDSIKSDLETFFNVTGVNDDNIQNSGISGSTKLADGSISTEKLANSSVTDAKIVDSAVTTAKLAAATVVNSNIADNAVTAAKANVVLGRGKEGCIMMFHTYNSTVSVPRGWMVLNGDVVNQTNYDAIHGSGAYTSDGIASSSLLSKNLPNFTDLYPVGVTSTSQDGSSPITSVGTSGSVRDFSHSHAVDSHTHTTPEDPDTQADKVTGPTANLPPKELTATGSNTASTTSSLTTTEDIRPESVKYLFIIKVI